MDDYRWYEFVDRPMVARFPHDWAWLAGAQEWAEGVERLRDLSPADAHRWLDRIRHAPKSVQAATCPRVFVSHRQIDDKVALRIAWLAWNEGFDYWLDLIDLDPPPNQQLTALERWLGRPPTDFDKSILTAAIIEMALLNCTHVLAAMTGNTKGSQWVPYEYGRIKDTTPVGMNAGSWWDSTILNLHELPEYLHLAAILDDESAVRAWLKDQMTRMTMQYPGCPGKARSAWPPHVPQPGPLPTG